MPSNPGSSPLDTIPVPPAPVTLGSRTSDFQFDLPESLIAQHPSERRGDSRLMIVERASGRISHGAFADLLQLIPPGDVLVVNRTRVLRSRLRGRRSSGGPGEVLLLRPIGHPDSDTWEAMVHPGGKLKPGRCLTVAPNLSVEIVEVTDRRTRLVRLHTPLAPLVAIERFGHIPLPPYIARDDAAIDAERYQTVYAREAGSVAAPTAGLHFTPALLSALETAGVRRAEVLLHVGAGTFKPVEVDDPDQHVMHEEWFRLDDAACAALSTAREHGGHLWAVGTTSARALESIAPEPGYAFTPTEGETRLFVRPGYRFRAVDRLITNFHLPRSTLLMLVAAFAGFELTMQAYRTAIAEGYRFYSYGDAMAIL
ncbi:MAG: S-adenosylmethionine:tRNA ribosyltransferase-isomerase [Gemmatimonadaceae bacterium]|nr:S-adenosylmethionine:tRNA ribosyltransferase-isomerase [Gemmatimonadaceae bacterium]